jgi:uncharacterized protein (TIGR02117 family)
VLGRAALVTLLFACYLQGCAASAPEPGTCASPRELHVLAEGWHTGLVFPARDLIERLPALEAEFGPAGWIEVGWGDERYYRAQRGSVGLALRAALWPTNSALHLAPRPDPSQLAAAGIEVVLLRVAEEGYRATLDFVVATFATGADGNIVRLGDAPGGFGAFFAAEGRFHLFNTCNTWVARGIHASGYPISTRVVTARRVMSQLPRGTAGRAGCYGPSPTATQSR